MNSITIKEDSNFRTRIFKLSDTVVEIVQEYFDIDTKQWECLGSRFVNKEELENSLKLLHE